MKEMPSFEGGNGRGEEKKKVDIAFPKKEESWTPRVQAVKGTASEKSRSGLLNKLRKALGVSSIALATLTGEGCKPEDGREGAPLGGEPTTTRVESKTSFSGYGISTETDKDGKLKSSSYGSESDGRKSFKGYGIER